jgi:hypothetical protein
MFRLSTDYTSLHVRRVFFTVTAVRISNSSKILTLKNVIFWDVAPCRSCVNQRFAGMYYLHQQQQQQKLTAGNQPARSILAPGPAGTHGHIFVQCQDLCFLFFSLSLILLIDKEGLVFYIYIEWCLLTTPYAT